MKTIQYKNTFFSILACSLILLIGCERDLDEDLPLATYPATAEVFTDTPVALGSNFYFPYTGSKPTAWSVDHTMGYESSASMRFDVPNANDPEGNFAGGIFRIDGMGRDLTGYDALTFYAKASENVTLAEIGFGEDFGENKYQTTRYGIQLTTNWVKYIIPIPDPSKLTHERGMFRYAASGIGETGMELGYSFWIDELKFEKLGTLAQARPKIQEGNDITVQALGGTSFPVTGLTQTFNTANGQDITVGAAPAYYSFTSSNPNTATVDEYGIVSIVGNDSATITATLGGVNAQGSVLVESLGQFTLAPTPTQDPADVISIFSDAYQNVPVDYYNGFWAPYQTTLGGTGEGGADLSIDGNGMINYTDLNFVGIATFENVSALDLTDMTHAHVDIYVPKEIQTADFITLRIATDAGTDNETNHDYTISSSQIVGNQWNSYDIPLSDFAGLSDKSNVGLFVFVTEGTNPNNPASITNMIVDNLYYYNDGNGGGNPTTPTTAAPTPTLPASNVISLFSDAYSNETVDTFRTDWSNATFQEVTIAGNATLEYTNLSFVGIETTSSTVDASSMTHLHMDVWTPNATQIGVKLVDFGANGVYDGGGDDSEFQIDYNAPTQGQWISYDIPLSDFTGLNGTAHLAQYILVGLPAGTTTLYVDNIYFHN